MNVTDMERHLENLDLRLARVEQILPTLATKTDLEDAKRYALVLNESTRDDIRIVAEAVASMSEQVASISTQLGDLGQRLQRKGVI